MRKIISLFQYTAIIPYGPRLALKFIWQKIFFIKHKFNFQLLNI